MLFVVRQYLFIEHVCSGDRRFIGIEFCMSHLAVGIYKRLLIHTPHTFKCAEDGRPVDRSHWPPVPTQRADFPH